MIRPEQLQSERGLRFRWQLARRAPRHELERVGALEPLLAQLLRNRGLVDAEQAGRFLAAEDEVLGDPATMAGLREAVERILSAINSDELIGIYGDYDVDGLTATAVLCLTLRRLGGRALPFIPHREKDGYGLRDAPLADLRQAGATLVVTVDCGITASEEIARARVAGLEVIVTDHHLVPAAIPDAIVLNPHRTDCGYAFKDLAGVGVAFRLAEALLRERLTPREADETVAELLELVALGTLADMMPLRGENRTVVRRGLERLNDTHRPGLRALIAAAGLEPGSVNADRVCFALVPRLNAAGRLEHAELALQLLLTDSFEEARARAERLNTLNQARRARTAEALQALRAQLAGQEPGPAVVVAGLYPVGLVGVLAGQLAEELNRPVIVLRQDGDVCTGSGRSVAGVNLVEALARGAEHLERFGGHAMAAGLRIRAERLEAFQQVLAEAVAAVRREAPAEPALEVDAVLRPGTAVSWSTLELLRRLEPHGVDNPVPSFLTRGLRVIDRRELAGGHLRARLAAPEAQLSAIAFGKSDLPLEAGEVVDVVYRLQRNVWRGTVAPELELLDWRPTGSSRP